MTAVLPGRAGVARAVAAALVWLAATAASPAPAQERAGQGTAAGDDADPAGTKVHLAETAGRNLQNDRVRAFLRAEAEGLEATEVQREVNRLMAAGLDAARAAEGVEASTEGYSVYYPHDERRWVGQQRLRLEATEPNRLLPLVGELQGMGFLMDGLDSYLSPEAAAAVTDELTVEAVGRVRDRVRLLADTLGAASSRIEELRFDGAGEPPPVPYRAMTLERAEAADMPPPAFEAGETRVEVRVEATAVLSPP